MTIDEELIPIFSEAERVLVIGPGPESPDKLISDKLKGFTTIQESDLYMLKLISKDKLRRIKIVSKSPRELYSTIQTAVDKYRKTITNDEHLMTASEITRKNRRLYFILDYAKTITIMPRNTGNLDVELRPLYPIGNRPKDAYVEPDVDAFTHQIAVPEENLELLLSVPEKCRENIIILSTHAAELKSWIDSLLS